MIQIENEDRVRTEKLDAEYERQKQWILDQEFNEEELKKRLLALDETYATDKEKIEEDMAKKEAEAKRGAAKADKAVALAGAIVSTAQAVARALTAGPIVGPILAGVIGALGAVQIGLIKNQPIPLAQGGILTGPTFLAGEAGHEVVMPLERVPEMVQKITNNTTKGTTVIVQNYVDTRKITEQVIKNIEKKARLGQLKIAAKAIQ